MKKKLTLLSIILSLTTCLIGQEVKPEENPVATNTYSLAPVIRQSSMHDAIQYFYAKNGFTFYFRQTRNLSEGLALKDYEVIDLVNNKNLGSITNYAEDLGISPAADGTYDYNCLMKTFLTKYNGNFKYVMTKIVPTAEDENASRQLCIGIRKEILKRNANIPNASDAQLVEAYKGNPYFDLGNDLDPSKLMAKDNARLSQNALISQLSLNQNSNFDDIGGGSSLAGNIAQGTAKFLIERANQEINAAFFRRLKKTMDETQELQKLFPEVYKLTSTIETYNFDAALNAMKTKLEEDLENLLANIPTLAEIESYKSKLNEVPELSYYFAICDILNGIKLNQNAGSIIHKVYISPYIEGPLTNEANILKLSGLLSFSLRDIMLSDENGGDKGWMSPSDLHYEPKALLEIFQYYLGFLAQVDPGVVFRFDKGEVSFNKFLLDNHGHVSDMSGFLSNTYASFSFINNEIAIIRTLSKNESTPEIVDQAKFVHYKNIAIEVVNIVERTVKYPKLFADAEKEKILKTTGAFKITYIPAAEKVLIVAVNLEKKNYNEAIFNAGELVTILLKKTDNVDAKNITGKIFKYGQFFASVATAKSGDDVKNAIDAIALPTGSSSIKKDLTFNVAINGYIGYFRRQIKKEDAFVSGFTQSYGITAPVGFTGSFGFKEKGSISAFAGIIDVGAIAQYQLKQDQTTGTTTAEPEIDWGNIISPSIHLVYGAFCYLPVSVGVGTQWLANNATISDDSYKLKPRWNFFIAFDIPMVNIVSVKRKGK